MPQPVIIILIVVGALLVLGLIFSVFFTFLVAYKVYSKTLMRDKNSHWGREHCSEPGNPALETMWKRPPAPWKCAGVRVHGASS